MLCMQSTPIDHSIPSPAELLNSRVYQTNLPAVSKPSLSLSPDGDVNTKFQTRQEQQKSQYDKTSKTLHAVYPDEPVRVLNPHSHKLEPGVITNTAQTPRSHVVAMANGSTLRRNRRHICPTGENVRTHDNNNTSMTEPEPASPVISYTATPSAEPRGNIPTSEQITTANPNTPCPSSPAEHVSSEIPLRRSSRMVKPPWNHHKTTDGTFWRYN